MASDRPYSSKLLKIVEMADAALAEAKIGEFDVQAVLVSKHTTPSNMVARKEDTDPYSLNLKDILKHKIYWMVYYEPSSGGVGGDCAVFVEDKTWKVLWLYRGK